MKATELIELAADDALNAEGGKMARVGIRVTESDKREIEQAAETLGLNITQYLVMIHRAVWRRLHERDKGQDRKTLPGDRARRGDA